MFIRKWVTVSNFFCISFLLSIFSVYGVASAQSKFGSERQFKLDQSCNATRSIRKKTDPTLLKAGEIVSATGVNKDPGATHVYVRVDGRMKWVALECGQFTDGKLISKGSGTRGGKQACLPFFDDKDNPEKLKTGVADITPKAPVLNAFDKDIANVCGAAGKVVSRQEFQAVLRKNMDVLKRIQAFTGGKVFAKRPAPATLDAYLDDLTDAWFKIKAFDHIFCGEPKKKLRGNNIGGLHFHGRYLMLQESGEACRLPNYRRNEVMEGVIYTMGVTMKNANGRFVKHQIKGYGLTLSAEDLFKVITLAFQQNPTNSNKSRACILSVKDDGHAFETVFVRRSSGIRTFYPDATPSRRDRSCQSVIEVK